jgi:hypothetical protein
MDALAASFLTLLFGDRLMVGQQPLKLFILVRIQAPEHKKTTPISELFLFRLICYFSTPR